MKGSAEKGFWFTCPNCGGFFAFFPDGHVEKNTRIPPKSICHSKPMHLVNVPNSVECMLYRLADHVGFDFLFENFKQHEEEIEPPDSMKPMGN